MGRKKYSLIKFSDEDFAYLTGKRFSSGAKIKISAMPGKEKSIPLRIEYIESLVQGKDIIHVGCVGHAVTIYKRIKNNTWLHKRLHNIANRCLGIDIDREGIKSIQEKYGYKDVICCDLINDKVNPVIAEQKWNYMILGEVLEHVDNPVLFLDSIKRKYSKHIDKLIITVPNAFKIENFIFIKSDNIEMINSDHRYWFTPYTLGKVVTRACLKIEGYGFFQSYQVTRRSEMEKELLINPAMRDTILMIVDLT